MASRSIYKILFLFFILFSVDLPAQTVTNSELTFLDYFLKDDPGVINYIDEDELAKSNCLGITYANTPIKFLLNYDVPAEIKNNIANGNDFQTDISQLGDNYSVLNFSTSQGNYSTKFYFKDGKCISPVTYFTRNYTKDSSEYFSYYISNPLYFNSYCKQELDEFTASMLDIMNFTGDERKFLAQNKITYVLCNTEEEITNIIGQNAKGIYLVAMDAVVTTYNTHNHEVAHLLMNYKIKNDIKLEHPFFLEGFATAFGGRGGLMPLNLLPVGQFSINTGFVNVNSLLSIKNFSAEDASVTYPAAGYYSMYLFLNKGFDEYLKTYLQFSGDFTFLNNIDSSNTSLPDYAGFLSSSSQQIQSPINVNVDRSGFTETIFDEPGFKIYKKDEQCLILLRNNLLLKKPGENFSYISKTFMEKFPGKDYITYKYLIEADYERIAIYDLFTNDLICSYNKSFDLQQREIPQEMLNDGNYYMFSIPYNFFEYAFSSYELQSIE